MNRRQCVVSASAAGLGLAMPRWSAALSRTLAMRPDAWFGRVTGAPPGKERCSSTEWVNFFYGAKQWLQEETVPDFLLLAREPRHGNWVTWRGYLGNSRLRYDGGYTTLRQARAYAESLTGGLLAPWVAVPHQAMEGEDSSEKLIAFARSQIAAEQQL